MTLTEARRHFAPWAAMVAGVLGWAIHQQLLADILYWNCFGVSPGLDLIVSALTSLLMAGGAWWTWTARQAGRGDEAGQAARRILADISLGTEAILFLATVAQALAGFIIPECHR